MVGGVSRAELRYLRTFALRLGTQIAFGTQSLGGPGRRVVYGPAGTIGGAASEE
jgi:hypothetical protein